MPDSLAMQNNFPVFRYGPIGGFSATTPTVSRGASGVAPAGGMNLDQLNNYINSLNLASTRAAESARIPMADQLEQQSSSNIASELAGTIDPDTLRLLQQGSAERGAAMGLAPDAANTQAAYLRALGLTSTQLKERGQSDLTAAFGRHRPAPTFDPTTQLVPPGEQQRIDIARQAEADRAAYEMASLNRGGGGRVAGSPSDVIGFPSPRGPASTLTGSDLFGRADFGTSDWWNSIGFSPYADQPGYESPSFDSPGVESTPATSDAATEDFWSAALYGE